MINFKYSQPTKIIFGKDTHKDIGQQVKKYGQNILIVYGSDRVLKNGVMADVETSLKEHTIQYTMIGGVQPNPRMKIAYEGIKICKENDIDFVLAVGGGSVIDTAKAIAVGAKYAGDVWDLYMKKSRCNQALPLGTVLTLAAAGSEASNGTVMTNDATGYKRDYGAECLRPVFSVLNPELTFTVPKYHTACGCADIMMHDMERYFTNVKNVDLTDRLCEGVLLSVKDNTHKVLNNPDDYDARAEIMWAGTVAHNDLLSTGRIGDWATHMIGHEIGALFDVAHGATLTIICPAWMTYVYKHDIARFKQFAIRVMGVEVDGMTDEEIALKGIEKLKAFFAAIGLPTSLGEVGADASSIDEMSEKATMFGNLGNFVSLDTDAVKAIYKLAL